MRTMKIEILLTFAFVVIVQGTSKSSVKKYSLVCYLGSWANYRHGDGKFVIEDIDPHLCTHLVYGFAKLGTDNKIAAYDPYLDLKENWGLGAFERFTALKKQNPSLKTLLAVGGWNEGSVKYSQMARQRSTRKVFVDSCVHFLQRFGFDGLDLDWEYPTTRDGMPQDKHNFVLLLAEMKEAFRPHNLLLTAAVSAGIKTVEQAYDVPALGKLLDLINVMAYDFHGSWDKGTGHNSPLYPRPEEDGDSKLLNVDTAVNYWLEKGAPAQKLILGMPLYGRSFLLQDAKKAGLDAPIHGPGMAGRYTQEQGFLGYNEICDLLQRDKSWKVTVNQYVEAPYAVKDDQWIGYDDVKSIKKKVAYLIKKKLGGGMVWSIETDDFHGKCHGQRYPLLRAINSGLNHSDDTHPEENSLEPTQSSKAWSWRISTPWSWGSTPPFGTTTPANDLTCTREGYFRHPEDCKLFYLCLRPLPGTDDDRFQFYLFRCGKGTVFSEEMRTCTFPAYVPGCKHVVN